MVFTHDTEVTLASVAALVNSLPGSVPGDDDPDTMTTIADLDDFVAAHSMTGRHERTRAELDQVRALRPRLASLWTLDVERAVNEVNALLAENRALPRLVRHDEFDWHLHATPSEAPLASRLAVEAGMAMVDVIRLDQWPRLRICESPTCDNVVVDLSKNRSRRYCDAGCGNRANVAAYRARQRRLPPG